ncbi:MAG: hypothetical protein ACPGQS_01980 [Bradymonadia bacterium]
MCNSSAHKTRRRHDATFWLVWLLTISCAASHPSHANSPKPESIVVRTSTESYGISETRRLFEEARVVASLQTDRSLTLKQLSDFADRYRVLTEHLQLRLMSLKAPKKAEMIVIQQLASKILNGYSLTEALEKSEPAQTSPEAIERLAVRVASSSEVVKEALRLLIQREYLINQLQKKLPQSYMLINWYEQNLSVDFEGLAVPRVPTSREIDRALGRLQPEIATAYEKNRRRFNRPPKIMANRIRVRWSRPRTPDSDRTIRSKIATLKMARESGQTFEEVLSQTGDQHAIRKGGRVTLNANAYPSLANLKAGTITPLMEDDVGVSFYEIKLHTPAFTRPLSTQTVQRELAAEILRETDQLPSAYRVAQQLSDLWVSLPERITSELSRIQGSKRISRGQFAPYASNQIPGVGLSEAGTVHLQQLKTGKVSGQPVRIRQDYLVFKVINWTVPALADWWQEAPRFWRTYEPQARQNLIRSWLKVHGTDQQVKVDKPTLAQMSLEIEDP